MLRNEPETYADAGPMVRYFCEDYIYTTHPETGVDVVVIPGDAMPAWLVAQRAEEAAGVPETPQRDRGNPPVSADRVADAQGVA